RSDEDISLYWQAIQRAHPNSDSLSTVARIQQRIGEAQINIQEGAIEAVFGIAAIPYLLLDAHHHFFKQIMSIKEGKPIGGILSPDFDPTLGPAIAGIADKVNAAIPQWVRGEFLGRADSTGRAIRISS
ncbi:hypothetical protein LCGC14_3082050, partial [marine sediment metagenome]